MSREVLARLEASVERIAKEKAVSRLEHALDYLAYFGDQWARGNAALALTDAEAILRRCIAQIAANAAGRAS